MRDAAADQAAGDEAGAVEWGGAGASVSGGIVREEHLNHETGERARKARKLSCVSRMFAPFAFQIAANAQRRIIEYLDGVQAQVAELKRLQAESAELERLSGAGLARAGRLRQAVLKQAFEGRLMPQDPDDELASVLLERIRKKRERKEQEKHVHQMHLPGT